MSDGFKRCNCREFHKQLSKKLKNWDFRNNSTKVRAILQPNYYIEWPRICLKNDCYCVEKPMPPKFIKQAGRMQITSPVSRKLENQEFQDNYLRKLRENQHSETEQIYYKKNGEFQNNLAESHEINDEFHENPEKTNGHKRTELKEISEQEQNYYGKKGKFQVNTENEQDYYLKNNTEFSKIPEQEGELQENYDKESEESFENPTQGRNYTTKVSKQGQKCASKRGKFHENLKSGQEYATGNEELRKVPNHVTKGKGTSKYPGQGQNYVRENKKNREVPSKEHTYVTTRIESRKYPEPEQNYATENGDFREVPEQKQSHVADGAEFYASPSLGQNHAFKNRELREVPELKRNYINKMGKFSESPRVHRNSHWKNGEFDENPADNLKNLKDFRQKNYFATHSTENLLGNVPEHTCVHRFELDNRYLLQPLNGDEYRTSRCIICGKPMRNKKPKILIDERLRVEKLANEPHKIYMGNDNVKIEVNIREKEKGVKMPQKPNYFNTFALRFQRVA